MSHLQTEQINEITDLAIDRIHDIYDYFDIQYKENPKLIRSKCFIHGGDNDSALNLYPHGDVLVHYKCRTHQCEKYFGQSFISMIRGFLSHAKYGWEGPDDETVSYDETIKFLLEFLNVQTKSLSAVNVGDKLKFSSQSKFWEEPSKVLNSGPTKEQVRKKLIIPSKYFLTRGFSREILNKFDVGESLKKNVKMINRAIVPIYDINHTYVGCTGRSIFEKCKCGFFHDPENQSHPKYTKWMNSAGFNKEKHLYNLNNAKPFILKTGVCVVVESPGNVWKLEEAGILNSVALLGASMNDDQKSLLDASGAMTLYCLMDNDSAGQAGANEIYKKTHRCYKVIKDFCNTDVAESNKEELETLKESIENENWG